jgi:hypothetical protein
MRKFERAGAVALCFAAFATVHAEAAQVVPPPNQSSPSAAPRAASSAAAQFPSIGLENPWDVRKIISDLQTDTNNLQPVLRRINPQDWSDKKGAPTTYIIQWQSAQQQVNDVISATRLFAQKTESLSLALDTYFRLEALEVTERALAEGVGRYDVPTTARELNTLIAHNFASRERIRGYIRDLAATTEENFKIADSEAQRCRETLSKQPLPAQARKSKKD